MTMVAIDCFEKELNIGDTVAYPVRKGSSMWINSGKIINIFEYMYYRQKMYGLTLLKPSGKKVTIHRVNRVIKVAGV